MDIQPSQQQNNQPVEPIKKAGIKFGLSIAIVVILIIAAGLAVYWIKTEPTEQSLINIITKKPADPTASWQTYRNDEYGFELKYPTEWNQESNRMIGKNAESMFYVSVSNVSFDNIQDWFSNEFKDRTSNEKPTYSSLTIAGYPAIHYVDPISIGGCLEDYVFIKNSVLYNLQRGPATCTYSENTFDQILSTFKFTP